MFLFFLDLLTRLPFIVNCFKKKKVSKDTWAMQKRASIKHERTCLTTFSNTENRVKNTTPREVFLSNYDNKRKKRRTSKRKRKNHCTNFSRARFWSSDLWVMGPARFHCATLLLRVTDLKYTTFHLTVLLSSGTHLLHAMFHVWIII